MELVLKNISPKDYSFIFDLAHRLGIQVEESIDHPDHISAIDDLKDAMNAAFALCRLTTQDCVLIGFACTPNLSPSIHSIGGSASAHTQQF